MAILDTCQWLRESNSPTTCLAEDLSLVLYVFGGTRINIFKCYTVTTRERERGWGKVCKVIEAVAIRQQWEECEREAERERESPLTLEECQWSLHEAFVCDLLQLSTREQVISRQVTKCGVDSQPPKESLLNNCENSPPGNMSAKNKQCHNYITTDSRPFPRPRHLAWDPSLLHRSLGLRPCRICRTSLSSLNLRGFRRLSAPP